MLPIVDKPLIQYIVNECVAAGIKEIILVTHSSKNAIENHFDTSFELEAMLEARVKRQLLDEVQSITPKGVTLIHIRQGQPKDWDMPFSALNRWSVIRHLLFCCQMFLLDDDNADLKKIICRILFLVSKKRAIARYWFKRSTSILCVSILLSNVRITHCNLAILHVSVQ